MTAIVRGVDPGRAESAPRNTPRIALMVITDGRWDYLHQTLESFFANVYLGLDWTELLIVDDSALDSSPTDHYKGWTVVRNRERLGLAGAIQAGWDALGDCDYVFHLEDDFTFPEPVDVAEMVGHLERNPTLAQVALLRQPWSPDEQRLGSLYAPNRADYRQTQGLVKHRRLFTFNPCVYPRTICDYGAGLEAEVTAALLAAGYEFAYLGSIDDPPRCTHIGDHRSAGYKL